MGWWPFECRKSAPSGTGDVDASGRASSTQQRQHLERGRARACHQHTHNTSRYQRPVRLVLHQAAFHSGSQITAFFRKAVIRSQVTAFPKKNGAPLVMGKTKSAATSVSIPPAGSQDRRFSPLFFLPVSCVLNPLLLIRVVSRGEGHPLRASPSHLMLNSCEIETREGGLPLSAQSRITAFLGSGDLRSRITTTSVLAAGRRRSHTRDHRFLTQRGAPRGCGALGRESARFLSLL